MLFGLHLLLHVNLVLAYIFQYDAIDDEVIEELDDEGVYYFSLEGLDDWCEVSSGELYVFVDDVLLHV